MKLIVGLGNPGRKYENTRHNIGFKVVSALAESHNIRLNKKIYSSLAGKGHIRGEEVAIALPQTYMNRSGETVGPLVSRRKTGLKDLLVICDDVNLSFGIIRIKSGGSAGGHKGLTSIIESLGSCEFTRLRVGVGKETQSPELSDYVLSPFRKDEVKILDSVVESAVRCCEVWLKEGAEGAARTFNTKNRKDKL